MRWTRRRSRPTDDTDGWMGPLPAAPGCDCQICRPEPSYDAHDRTTIDGVLHHGWQVLLVSDSVDRSCADHDGSCGPTGEDPGPSFAYTVGLGHRAGHPELLMAGLDVQLMHRVLNEVAGRVMGGRRLVAGDVLEGVLGGVPVVLEQVSETGLREAVTWSGWFHRRRPDALMVVWPTTSGLFAWQPGAPEVLDQLQPPEWRERIEHRGAVGSDPPWELPVPPDRMAFTCTHVMDEGEPVLWVARESDVERGEDWTIHCGGGGHASDEIRLVHIAHLVRGAPSLRQLSDLGLDREASRDHVDAPWATAPLS